MLGSVGQGPPKLQNGLAGTDCQQGLLGVGVGRGCEPLVKYANGYSLSTREGFGVPSLPSETRVIITRGYFSIMAL